MRSMFSLVMALLFMLSMRDVVALDLAPYKTMPLPSPTAGVAIGDVTGDGLNDLVAITSTKPDAPAPAYDYSVFVYAQGARGLFLPPVSVTYSSKLRAFHANHIALSDLNGDGIKDIIVGHEFGVTFFAGNSARVFVPKKASSGSNNGVTGMALIDVNLDNKLDVVHTRTDDSNISNMPVRVYYGDGTGGFPNQSELPADTISGPGIVRVGDVRRLVAIHADDDGLRDLLAWQSGYLWLMRQNGTGAFKLSGSPGSALHILFADFTGDGLDDYVMWRGGVPVVDYLLFYVQGTGGVFSYSGVSLPVTDLPLISEAADADGDGDNDVFAVNYNTAKLGYFERTSTGFAPAVEFALPGSRYGGNEAIAVGDLNNDGCKDIAISNYETGIALLYGRNAASCRVVLPPRPTETGFRELLPAKTLLPLRFQNGPASRPHILRRGSKSKGADTDSRFRTESKGERNRF